MARLCDIPCSSLLEATFRSKNETKQRECCANKIKCGYCDKDDGNDTTQVQEAVITIHVVGTANDTRTLVSCTYYGKSSLGCGRSAPNFNTP